MTLVPNLLVFSGAGLSAPSGIPTFRDSNGLWHNHSIDQVCDWLTWKNNADIVHKFYNQRRLDLATVEPNAAHAMIAQWQKNYKQRVTVVTQNVDLLLEAAGCVDVVHVHGELDCMQCTACGHRWQVPLITQWDPQTDRCVKCSSRRGVKPGVVFFNEHAPKYAILGQVVKHLHAASMIVVIGTSGTVVDIQSLICDRPGTRVLCNLEAHGAIDHNQFHHVFYESAVTAVTKIDELVSAHMQSSQGSQPMQTLDNITRETQ